MPSIDKEVTKKVFNNWPEAKAIIRADDVTMDCTKCKAHIRAETLEEVEQYLVCPVCGSGMSILNEEVTCAACGYEVCHD